MPPPITENKNFYVVDGFETRIYLYEIEISKSSCMCLYFFCVTLSNSPRVDNVDYLYRVLSAEFLNVFAH